jgi:hypothetical protein
VVVKGLADSQELELVIPTNTPVTGGAQQLTSRNIELNPKKFKKEVRGNWSVT